MENLFISNSAIHSYNTRNRDIMHFAYGKHECMQICDYILDHLDVQLTTLSTTMVIQACARGASNDLISTRSFFGSRQIRFENGGYRTVSHCSTKISKFIFVSKFACSIHNFQKFHNIYKKLVIYIVPKIQ